MRVPGGVFIAIAVVVATPAAQRGPAPTGILPSQIFTAPPPRPIPEGTGRIFGRVLDRDLDTPISNATITIGYLGQAQSTGLRAATGGLTLSTDDRGEFVAQNLATGDYAVYATADGHTRARRYGSTIDPGERVSLTPANTDGTATIRLSQVASVSGVITDAAGSPVNRIPVRIYHHVFNGHMLHWQPMPVTTFTDEAGRYRFSNAPPGEYTVGVYLRTLSFPVSVSEAFWSSPGSPVASTLRSRLDESAAVYPPSPVGGPTAAVYLNDAMRWAVQDGLSQFVRLTPGILSQPMRRTTFAPSAATIAEAQPVILEPGENRTGVNIALKESQGVKVSGALAGEAEKIAHVGLRLVPAGDADVLQTFPNDVATTVTDATGRFTFVSVPPGSYLIESRLMSPAPPPPSPPLRTLLATVGHAVEVQRQDVSDLRIAIQQLRMVRGRIELDTTGPGPRDPKPVPNNFSLIPVGPRGSTHRMVSVGTDFAFENVPPARYLISAPNFGGWTVTSIRINGRESLHRSFDITMDIDDVVVTMKNQLNRLAGNVTDTSGAGLPGAQVVMFPADFQAWADGGRAPLAIRAITAGSRGVFTISALNDGDYLIVAFSNDVENDWRAPGALRAIAPLAQRVRLQGGTIVNVEVKTVLPGIPKTPK